VARVQLNETHVVVGECKVAENVWAIVARHLWHTGHHQLLKLTSLADVRPVLVTLDTATLHVRRQHHDQRWSLVPNHRPKVVRCLRERALCCNVPIDHSRSRNLHLQATERQQNCWIWNFVVTIFIRLMASCYWGEWVNSFLTAHQCHEVVVVVKSRNR